VRSLEVEQLVVAAPGATAPIVPRCLTTSTAITILAIHGALHMHWDTVAGKKN